MWTFGGHTRYKLYYTILEGGLQGMQTFFLGYIGYILRVGRVAAVGLGLSLEEALIYNSSISVS